MNIESHLIELKQQLVSSIAAEELDEKLISKLLQRCEQLFSDTKISKYSADEIKVLQEFGVEFNTIVAEVENRVQLMKTDLNTLRSGKKMRDFYAK